MRRRLFSLLMMGVFLIGSGCSSGPATSGSEQYFTDAKSSLAKMDYDAALKNLDRLIKTTEGQPLGKQGAVLRTALLAAMADGTKQMAEAYGGGAGQSGASGRQGKFIKMKSDYYGIARARLMSSMEAVMAQRNKLREPMALEIPFPDFAGTDPAAITKIQNGQWVDDSERYRAEIEAVRNSLARTLARLAGAGDDVHKGHATFDKGGVQIDPRIYLLELSNMFYKLSEMFDRRALDDARYRRISLEVVRDNADLVLKMVEAKPDKDLETRAKKLKADCEAALKKLGN